MNSIYNDEIDSSDCICPYCGYRYQVESEDFSEDGRVEECGECGKKFHHSQSFSVDTCTEPDCKLNGDEHAWVAVDLQECMHDFCSMCGKCRPFSETEGGA